MPLIELEEPQVMPVALEKGLLERTHNKLSVASEISQGAKIATHIIKKGDYRQLSVFVYPYSIILNPERILSLDQEFAEVQQRRMIRKFKDLSVEDLHDAFLRTSKPVPFMNHDYQFRGTQIKESSFDWGQTKRVEEAIRRI